MASNLVGRLMAASIVDHLGIAAVRTVAFTPTMNGVAVLAMIIAIRTLLSWTLALELDGRWPWQRAH